MKNYFIDYYTTDGHRMGMVIAAYNETEANILSKNLPNFAGLAACIREV